ncbi:MAG: kinase-associated lipoprotein B [Bacillota bacterium]|nr:kinase-associated lipoprotein B [Bacillota bacterium]
MEELKIGDKVTAIYKTGKYIGEITEIRPQHYLVRALAVLRHPMQGDIHHPKDMSVGIFHERRALAFREQANIPFKMVKPYEDDILEYKTSLKTAVDKMIQELSEESTPWAEKSLEFMHILEKDYLK